MKFAAQKSTSNLCGFQSLASAELADLSDLLEEAEICRPWSWAASALLRALDLAIAAEICRREEKLPGDVRWRPRALADISHTDLDGLLELWEEAAERFAQRGQRSAARLCVSIVELIQQESLRRSAVLVAFDRAMVASYGEDWSALPAAWRDPRAG